MASLPELAPENQNHLLRTSSVLRNISYGAGAIRYEKYDATSSERFKVGEWTPRTISGGKMQWNPKTKVLSVQSTEKSVTIRAK